MISVGSNEQFIKTWGTVLKLWAIVHFSLRLVWNAVHQKAVQSSNPETFAIKLNIAKERTSKIFALIDEPF